MRLVTVCVMATVFGFVGSMPFAGPVSVLVLSRATRDKFGEALRIGLGAAAAEAAYAGVAFWGYTTFLARHAIVVPISHGVTTVVLVALGVWFAFWRPEQGTREPAGAAGTFFFGFSVSAINPTLLLTWSAAVAFLYSKGLKDPPSAYAVPFGASAGAGVGGWFGVLVLLLRRYGSKVRGGAMTWTVRALGIVLVVLGVSSGVRLARWIGGKRQAAHRVFYEERVRAPEIAVRCRPGLRPARRRGTAGRVT